ncbi:Divalent cation transporter [Popillia japonica]|uniref:Divalent cation transporter n=1 Tax=Popillia japonica TaxID=7064 RepID=A0AAW1NJS0_POPJA
MKDLKELEFNNGNVQVESQVKIPPKDDPESVQFSEPMKEDLLSIGLQIFVPFMIAGMGTIGAGLVLGNVEELEVYKEVKALYIMVPALIGLKGNLDMCLASRLSTQANLGNIDSRREFLKMIIGNVFLVQIQAIVASCIVAVFAVSASSIINGTFVFNDSLLLSASSTITATTSCFVLDFVLIAVIFVTRKFRMNPDNMATPIAASIGDVVSLLILSLVASLLYAIHDTHTYVLFIILGIYIIILLPLWILIVTRNKYTKAVLKHGWVPVISALIISGTGGLVLDSAVDNFSGFVVFQPIINGIGGNLVSIQASRLTTMLHQTSIPGVIPPHTKQWVAPWTALFGKLFSAKTAMLLMAISIPGQTIFVLVADVFYNNYQLAVTAIFVLSYLFVFLIQLSLLLYTAHLLVHTMWKFKIDPDNGSIPYLTALGDLSGTCLLFLAFSFLQAIGRDYTPVH